MKTYGSSTASYRTAGGAHGQVDFLSFRVKDKDTPSTTQWFHFCSAEDDITVTVTDPDTGSSSRTFLGGGHIVVLDPIIRSEGGGVRNMNWALSGASSEVLDMVYGFNCREALAQYFVGERDQDTGLMLDPPSCEFAGIIDTVSPSDSAIGPGDDAPAESIMTVSVASLGATLLRINGDMRAPAVAEKRSGDEIFQYAAQAALWHRVWGKRSRSKKDRDGGKKGGKKHGDNHGGPHS
jgi:hypothetical protein